MHSTYTSAYNAIDARMTRDSTVVWSCFSRQKLESMAYIFVADSMGLSSLKFLWWAPKDASLIQWTAYRPFKVIQGRWFWHQSKGRMDFLLVVHSNFGPMLHCFWSSKVIDFGLSVGEDFVILACVVFTQCQRVTDGQTDGRTDRQTDIPIVASTGLAATADAL